MKKIMLIAAIAAVSFAAQGCLLIEKMRYEITISDKSDTTGVAVLYAEGIYSDATGKKELDQDTTILWDIYFQRDEFLGYMAETGKKVLGTELDVVKKKLSGNIQFSFNSIRNVESIQFDGEYYYYTNFNKDSVSSTNGTVIRKPEYTRIIWPKEIKNIEFELVNIKPQNRRDLVPFYNEKMRIK
ncbi:MAG: hypothetical protein LC102_08300 [Ignavibacteriales bacterium]|mgnify:CR=1 FL=1|jgi:hypothetical protein|nr:MAG: hypothetical protein F9K26_09575 [Ignavibacteriaceae bacterium]MBW7872690.1 hypothetical protein [Ignavibacteria bacterium]MCZ2143411.1 hypothetical protein [Ignavibacteriales bacterium]OQY74076.1 MAG: hypothetical protein B6D45_07245 [Ignavibacteriales bacterium UTCHB3]MBV6444290.1 hypothetical protein [Ignavibacteriaceae bacterium]